MRLAIASPAYSEVAPVALFDCSLVRTDAAHQVCRRQVGHERRWQHRMGMTLLTDYFGAAVTGGSRIELNQNGASGLSSRVPALDQVIRLESLVIFIVVGRWWAADGNWRVLAAGHGLWVVGRWLRQSRNLSGSMAD